MRRPRRQSAVELQNAVDAFNATHKPGDTIHVWTGQIEGEASPRQIREWGAVVLGGHTAVVYVAGGGGSIALTHVREWRERNRAIAAQ